jgi:diguanylate cyclase (GGDEF)-like protein
MLSRRELDVRDRLASLREPAAPLRLDNADRRDRLADARDRTAAARDAAADARDEAAAARDRALDERDGESARSPDRARAAEQRELAARDRRAAAHDREQAARERRHALADREALARELAACENDALTGARTRATGLRDLTHEIARARRDDAPLVVAYVDVVGLKAVNDAEGHMAGDALLVEVVTVIASHLRTYDLIIRVGGDEFVCVLCGTAPAAARRRFDEIAAALAAAPRPAAVRTGFAALADGDTAAQLIARADAEILAVHSGAVARRQARRADTATGDDGRAGGRVAVLALPARRSDRARSPRRAG